MNKKNLRYINTLFLVFPMTTIMAFVGISRNHGFADGLLYKVFHAWLVMFPVAYFAAFLIIPVANRLTQKVASGKRFRSS